VGGCTLTAARSRLSRASLPALAGAKPPGSTQATLSCFITSISKELRRRDFDLFIGSIETFYREAVVASKFTPMRLDLKGDSIAERIALRMNLAPTPILETQIALVSAMPLRRTSAKTATI